MVKHVPVNTIFTIPDNSGSQNGDICRVSMWGIYRGIGDVHRFYCAYCQMIITSIILLILTHLDSYILNLVVGIKQKNSITD